jgi:hypothetical protein
MVMLATRTRALPIWGCADGVFTHPATPWFFVAGHVREEVVRAAGDSYGRFEEEAGRRMAERTRSIGRLWLWR